MNIELAERNHFGMLLSDWHTQRRPGWRGSPPSATQNLERFVSGEICHILTSASASSHGPFFFFPFFDGEGKKNNQIIPIALVQRRSQHLPKTIYSQFMTAFVFFYTSRFIFGYCYTRRPLGLRQTRSYCSFYSFFVFFFSTTRFHWCIWLRVFVCQQRCRQNAARFIAFETKSSSSSSFPPRLLSISTYLGYLDSAELQSAL